MRKPESFTLVMDCIDRFANDNTHDLDVDEIATIIDLNFGGEENGCEVYFDEDLQEYTQMLINYVNNGIKMTYADYWYVDSLDTFFMVILRK